MIISNNAIQLNVDTYIAQITKCEIIWIFSVWVVGGALHGKEFRSTQKKLTSFCVKFALKVAVISYEHMSSLTVIYSFLSSRRNLQIKRGNTLEREICVESWCEHCNVCVCMCVRCLGIKLVLRNFSLFDRCYAMF